MARLTPEQKAEIIRNYELAYENANPGRRIRVVHKGRGWYTLFHVDRDDTYQRTGHRIGTLVEMTERLNARAKWVVEG